MKKEICVSLILLFITILFVLFKNFSSSDAEYQILKVIEADKFYVDLNRNSKIDDNELVKLSGIKAFRAVVSDYTKKEAEILNMNYIDYAKIGILAKKWAIENLEGKTVKLEYTGRKDTFDNIDYVNVKLDNKNLAILELDYGLAYLNLNYKNFDYFQYFNKKQIKFNIDEVSKTKLLLLNKNSNILHKLNCEHVQNIKYAELVFEKEYLNLYKNCKSCFNLSVEKSDRNNIKSVKEYPKSIYKKFDEIEIYLINPYEFKKPNSSCDTQICKRIVFEIESAKEEINLAIYGFGEQNAIYNALLKAKQRGVKITSVVDYSDNMDKLYSNTIKFINEFGSKTDDTNILMHNKFIIFDNKKVLTGSANISSAGTGGYNSNNVLIISNKAVVKAYKDEFNQMYAGKFSLNKKDMSVYGIKFNDAKIDVLFSPIGARVKNEILKNIKNAQSEIFVSIFYLTDKAIINELIFAKQRGVKVLILQDALGASNFKDRLKLLRNANILLKVENWGGKNHEKTMVIDRKILITGSCNFSSSGFYKNNENVLIIENSLVAEFYADYFLNLFNKIDDKYLKLIPKAESLESLNSCFDGLDNDYDGLIDGEDDSCKIAK